MNTMPPTPTKEGEVIVSYVIKLMRNKHGIPIIIDERTIPLTILETTPFWRDLEPGYYLMQPKTRKLNNGIQKGRPLFSKTYYGFKLIMKEGKKRYLIIPRKQVMEELGVLPQYQK